MNYFAHALDFLGDPYFVAGTAVPDLLTVADRGVRLRRRHLARAVHAPDPLLKAVARGIGQHLDDDVRFHESRAFVELSMAASAAARDFLQEPSGMRPAFLGHLLVEILLDASLIAAKPERLDDYYRLLDQVDPVQVEASVNVMAPRPTRRLAGMIVAFCRERILWDYLNDATLLRRLNQVMRRVGLAELPAEFVETLPALRGLVDRHSAALIGRPHPAAWPERRAPGSP